MSKLIVFGDIHLNDSRPWSNEVSEELIEYISGLEYNNSDNIALFLGDLTEKNTLSGTVFSYLQKLFYSLRFKKTYILMGNHDIKYNERGVSYPFSFVNLPEFKGKTQSKIEVIMDHKMEIIGNKKFLFLPYRIPLDGVGNNLYSTPLDSYKNEEFDSVFGHFTEESMNGFFGETIDISWINTKDRCFGHIHNSDGKNYLGSIIPNSVSEANKDRFIKIYDLSGNSDPKVEKIPPIFDYYTIVYPNNIPKVDSRIVAWTVDNCIDEATARSRYGNIHIRQLMYNNKSFYSEDTLPENTIENQEELSSLALFDMWAKESKLDEHTRIKARKYLEG